MLEERDGQGMGVIRQKVLAWIAYESSRMPDYVQKGWIG
jgi:hypothetical protein